MKLVIAFALATFASAFASGPAAREAPARAPEAVPRATFAAPSLRGTDVDGALETDAQGRFVPSRKAILLFDYYLAASGEVDEQAIRARVVDYAERHLRDPAPAIALFDRHVRDLRRR